MGGTNAEGKAVWAFFRRLDDGSRMSREVHVRFCEQRRGKFPPLTLLVAAFEEESDARRFRVELNERLKKFGLETAEEKTRVLFKWLNRRSQRRSYEWRTFNRLLKRHGIGSLRIRHQPATQLELGLEIPVLV